MFYGNDVQDTREVFFSSWEKYTQKKTLTPLENQVLQVILAHPEYHTLLESRHSHADYFPELGQTNPFLHMGLHLAIRDQITTDRPQGITIVFQRLLKKYGDELAVEHVMMEHLVECLWQAQREQQTPDEQRYLKNCKQLLEP